MKYKLTDERMEFDGHILNRIECVESFNGVNAGDKGGWIANESNLSQIGNSWVYDNAKVYGNARVYDDAQLYGNAIAYGDAFIHDRAKVYGSASIFGYAHLYDNACIYDYAIIRDQVEVYGNAKVFTNAHIFGNARVFDSAEVGGNAQVYEYAKVHEHAAVYGNSIVRGCSNICGVVFINGDTCIVGNAVVKLQEDYIVFKNNWSSGRYFTYTKSNKMWKVGCFYGTGEELIKKAYADSVTSGECYEATVHYVEELENIMRKEQNFSF